MNEPTTRLRLDLPLLLPDVQDADDRCTGRLIAALSGRPGIAEAHIARDGGAPQLCIHYDPAQINISRVRELVHAAGAQVSERFGHLVLRADAALHARAARNVANGLRSIPGVLEADVAASGAVRIEYDRQKVSAKALLAHAATLGLKALDAAPADTAKPDDHGSHEHGKDDGDHTGHDHAKAVGDHAGHSHGGGPFGEMTELVFAGAAGALLGVGWLLERVATGPAWLPTALYVAAYFFGGYYTGREAFDNLRAKRFEIDTLMLVAAIGAAALGKWVEGALLLFLFSLGHSLEHYAMGRARKAIEALAKLAPETATVRRTAGTEEIAVAALQVADVVIVRPNERLPADGVVVVGTTSVNQAPVTGESVPVDKRPVADAKAALAAFDRVSAEHRVFAGTINGSGAIEVMVARRAEQSTMARVVKMVTEAEAQRSPTQQFTERFERLFVPAVLVLVVVLLFAGVVIDEPFSASFYRAMAVLVAASPCALAISVPSAVLSGVARAGRGGVLVKGGGPLENLGTLTSIAFDKTGTLTEGKPRLTDVVAMPGVSEDELLAVAQAVEQRSDHPLASAVVAGATERLGGRVALPAVSDVKSITGRGVQAQVGGETAVIGKPVLFSELPGSTLPPEVAAANDKLVAAGRTTMVVRHGERFLGVIAVMDTPRPVAAQVMTELRELGIERLIMISGDNQQVAEAVAKSVGLTEARGDLMPEQKVDAIKVLRDKHGKVAMVGDGVNDAPAMANSTVGIAMGAAGSDVALETADVALMADDLAQLPFAVGLSRSTSRIIKQNLYVSLGVVAVLIPATIFGLNIGTAVLFHEGSTLIVVVNALRLLAYRTAARPAAGAVPSVAAA
ncbi:heavy metal translocating P-type ATPase [Noviherbaspirillum sp. CPCC 100848]|uniref:Heavy metal translocating P-type ATPase n=1 Tax=Noviherbaspirillum album TaxID=3080276 RepID=A0ABU6J4Y9_9BURK|nr:heavy metal translocating P-type ATPase [Noviherbaspirillum sp. CPCC 100848]MEC4718450.1 heavy metal translocating P-type ATPase [Noviherbaspirillum sp. CPCC 100848]